MANQFSAIANALVNAVLGIVIFCLLMCKIDIETDPAKFTGTLNFIMIPIMFALSIFHGRYTLKNPRYSVIKYIVSGIAYLVLGIIVFYLVAVVFGAPAFGSFEKTFTWACLVSTFTFLPCGCAIGPNNYSFLLKSG